MIRLLTIVALLLMSIVGIANAQTPPMIETNEYGYSQDGEVWTYQNVSVSSTGITAVYMFGDIFYVIGSEYTGPLPAGDGDSLCWCSIAVGLAACKCTNYCAVNGNSGTCNVYIR